MTHCLNGDSGLYLLYISEAMSLQLDTNHNVAASDSKAQFLGVYLKTPKNVGENPAQPHQVRIGANKFSGSWGKSILLSYLSGGSIFSM